MKDDEHDDLWDFLGKAREPKVSSFFAANVLRKVREEEARPKGFAAVMFWLRSKWFIPATAAACSVALFVMSGGDTAVNPSAPTPSVDEMAMAFADSSELPMIAELDTLLAADHNSVWLEADPSSLY